MHHMLMPSAFLTMFRRILFIVVRLARKQHLWKAIFTYSALKFCYSFKKLNYIINLKFNKYIVLILLLIYQLQIKLLYQQAIFAVFQDIILIILLQRNMKNSVNIQLKDTTTDIKKLQLLRYSQFDTIKPRQNGKYVQMDRNFIQDVKAIALVRTNVISNLIKRTEQQEISDSLCDQLDYKARLHRNANILNSNSYKQIKNINDSEFCKCGCKRARGEMHSMLQWVTQIETLGSGVILMFMFLQYFGLLLIFTILIYGIFALVSNITGQEAVYSQCSDWCSFKVKTSLQNKNFLPSSLIIQYWLGVLFCLIWIFAVRVIKYLGKKKNQQLDMNLNSASDYAIKIENLPYGDYSETQLIEYFSYLHDQMQNDQKQTDTMSKLDTKKKLNQSQQELRIVQANNRVHRQMQVGLDDIHNSFHMKRIQIVYNMKFARLMIEEIFQRSLLVYSLLIEKDTKQHQIKDLERYHKEKTKLIQTYQLLEDLRKKFLNDVAFRRSLSTTCCIVEFSEIKDKDLLLNQYGSQKIGLVKRLQQNLKGMFKQNKNILFKGKILMIQRAPQPSDILWNNCEQKYSIKRIIFIYFITFVIIIVSFGILQGLDFLQQFIAKNYLNNPNDQSILTIVNVGMSLILIIINNIFWLVLFYLLDLEYNHTLTQKIVSQMNKALVATSANVIVLPIITNYIVRNQFYGNNGLTGIVFDYHFSLAVLGVLIRFINPVRIIKKIIIFIRPFRNALIRYFCTYQAQVDPEKGVQSINQFYQGHNFDVADTYVAIMGAIFHAAFFVTLQPTIIYFLVFTLIGFYWYNKYMVLKACKIPEMTDYLIFENAIASSNFVPILYGIGTISMSYLGAEVQRSKGNIQVYEKYPLIFAYITGGICIIMGIIGHSNPKDFLNIIVEKVMNSCYIQKQNYKDNKTLKENYYQNSNSLQLFGFQKVLRGQSQRLMQSQLVEYCQSFFYKYDLEVNEAVFKALGNFDKMMNNMQLKPLKLNKFIHKKMQQQQQKQEKNKTQQNPFEILFKK